MSFGENLINLRRQKGWSQDDLANNLNISRQAISKWENNTSKPDVDNIEKISKIFSVKIDELLNNELPNDKAVALDVKKEEKKEKTITIVKLMIIAVIILYAISVIYKFASLLVIVNGVQKYANLNNYHYVITTYDENGLAEKEECWFKDGVSKTAYEAQNVKTIICLDYNNMYGYIEDEINDSKEEINMNNYLALNINFDKGAQFYSKLPIELRTKGLFSIIVKVLNFNELNLNIYDEYVSLKFSNNFITIDNETVIPVYYYAENKNNNGFLIYNYKIDINTLEKVDI